jgi:succinoglycan biosynthesis transport protein ExoP
MPPPLSEKIPAEPGGYLTAAPAEATSGSDVSLADAMTTLRKRKYIVIVLAVLGCLYGLYKNSTQPRLYSAYGRIEIRSGSSNQYRVAGSLDAATSGNSRIPTEVVILKSDTLLFTVAQDLDLANNPDFLGLKQRPPRANTDDPAVRQQLIQQLSDSLSVTQIPKTDLVTIVCKSYSAKLSADIVNKLIDEYITRSVESRVESQKRASNFLTGTLDDLKHKVETAQEQLIDLQKNLGMLAIDPTHNEISASLDELTKAAGEAEITRILAESRYRVLRGMDPDTLDENVANIAGAAPSGGYVSTPAPGGNIANAPSSGPAASELQSLRQQLTATQADLAKLTAPGNLNTNHPKAQADLAQIAEIKKQIEVAQQRVIAQAKETFIAAQADEAQTRAALEAEKSEAYKLRDDLVEYTIRQREADADRTLYEGLVSRLQTASVQAGLEGTEIDIVDQAMPPPGPTVETRSSFVITNTLIAVLLGVILAFILESLDNGLRSVAEIEAISGLPSLALIPRSRRTGAPVSDLTIAQRNVGALSSPKSQFTEAFRALRTSLLLSTAGSLPKVILLTSATPSEGKTTVCTNLACVLAQNDVRVLMIDGDLRRPTVHHRLGLNGKIGLTSVLTGTATLEQAVQKLPELPNLEILVSGPVPPFPTEMLGSQTMLDLLEQCRGIYTHVVIDSPPLLSVTDGVVLARSADAVVLIVRHGRSGKQTVRRARDLLARAGAPVTGIAINAVDLSSPEYYGYYGYSVYSGYGSSSVETAAWESKSGNGEKGDKQ